MINNKTGCDYEPEVVKSLKSGFSNAEISEHLKSCNDCRETAKIVQFFQMIPAKEKTPQNIPSAGLIWWKAQLQKKRTANEKIGQPLMIAQTIAIGFVLFALIGCLIYQPAFFSSLENVLAQTFDAVAQVAAFLIIGGIAFALIVAVLGFTMSRSITEK